MYLFLKKLCSALLPVFFIVTVVFAPQLVVHAQFNTSNNGSGNTLNTSNDGNGNPFNTSNNGGGVNDPHVLQNPLAVDSICQLVNLLLKAAIAIGIPIAVLFIVYAGFKFITARGSPGALTEARANLVATLIGIAIFIGASLIASVIMNTLQQLGVQGVNAC